MSKILKEFEKLWGYQQGAIFLKKDSIYSLRKNLAEYFYQSGYNTAIKAVSEREKRLVNALEKINSEELSSQRPGGGYSNSAKISYEALKDYRGEK